MKKKTPFVPIILSGLFCLFIVLSFVLGIEPGIEAGRNFLDFGRDVLGIIPAAFILIGLFEIWVPEETVRRHLGEGSGFMAYLWVFLLAGTTVGGLYVAFPVAHALYTKKARLGIVFTYLGFAGVCRIPMTLFEVSFMGPAFTALRYGVSIPLIIITSELLGRFLEKRGYEMLEGKG